MSADKQSDKPKAWSVIAPRLKEGALIVLCALLLFFLVTLLSYNSADPGWSDTGGNQQVANLGGPKGAWLADVLFSLFGVMAFLFPILLGIRIWMLFGQLRKNTHTDWVMVLAKFMGFVLTLVACTALATIAGQDSSLPFGAGGMLGENIGLRMAEAFGLFGSRIILIAVMLFGLTLFLEINWLKLLDNTGAAIVAGVEKLKALKQQFHAKREEKQVEKAAAKDLALREMVGEKRPTKSAPIINSAKTATKSTATTDTETSVAAKMADSVKKKLNITPMPKQEHGGASVDTEDAKPKTPKKPLFSAPVTGSMPSLELLTPHDKSKEKGFSTEALENMSRLLELRLKDFGVDAEVVEVFPGPVITRFEIQPGTGVKVSKISNLAKDIARSMAVISVRVVEVIPGKPVVGIEIPNEDRNIVNFKEVLSSNTYEDSKSPLTIALGHDIAGEPVVADLAKMPHLLVAGTTGSGKSVGVNAMLMSMLYKASPSEVRMILVDPKMLELSVYEGIPHLLTPVITDMKDAANGLRWCVGEMERRYKLMSAVGVRNLAGFNKKVEEAVAAGEPIKDPLFKPEENYQPGLEVAEAPDLEPLPSIVVVIDEFADMIMIVGKKVEELIARIAQKARAAGIHLILATQRPSVDVITGLIKANVPTRIAFQVSSRVDSRTILDQGGAEQLLGHGDMLYMPPGTSLAVRVHGAFVSDDEVHRVVADWKARGKPSYIEGLLDDGASSSIPGIQAEGGTDGDDGEQDALYDEAVHFVTSSGKVSISSVQRKFRIGYNRAARLVETMEASGVVSEAGHNGMREVLAPPPMEH